MEITFDGAKKCWVMHCPNGPLEIYDVLCTGNVFRYVPFGFGADGAEAVKRSGVDYDKCAKEWAMFVDKHNGGLGNG